MVQSIKQENLLNYISYLLYDNYILFHIQYFIIILFILNYIF